MVAVRPNLRYCGTAHQMKKFSAACCNTHRLFECRATPPVGLIIHPRSCCSHNIQAFLLLGHPDCMHTMPTISSGFWTTMTSWFATSTIVFSLRAPSTLGLRRYATSNETIVIYPLAGAESPRSAITTISWGAIWFFGTLD